MVSIPAASSLTETESFVFKAAVSQSGGVVVGGQLSQQPSLSLTTGQRKTKVSSSGLPNNSDIASAEVAADGSNSSQSLSPKSALNFAFSTIENSFPETAVRTSSWKVFGNSAAFQWNSSKSEGLTQGTAKTSVSNPLPLTEEGAVPNPHGSTVVNPSSTAPPSSSGRAAGKASYQTSPSTVDKAATAIALAPTIDAVTNTVPQVPFHLDPLSASPIVSNAGANEAVPSMQSTATSGDALQPPAPNVAQGFIPGATLAPLTSGVVGTLATPEPSQFWNETIRTTTATTWNGARDAVTNTPRNSISNTLSDSAVESTSTLFQAPARWSSVSATEGYAASAMQSSAPTDNAAQNPKIQPQKRLTLLRGSLWTCSHVRPTVRLQMR
jgi:hypothetical protein